MDQAEIERERRNGRIAGVLGLVGAVLFVLSNALPLAQDWKGADGFADSLLVFEPEKSEVLVLLLLQALSVLLFIPALLVLFGAVRNRSEAFRPGLVGLCIAGPAFFAGALIASYFAFSSAADAFEAPALAAQAIFDPIAEFIGDDAGELDLDDGAEEVYFAQSTSDIASGLRFAGQLGLTFIIVYTSLYAMRTGLMTRFWGTLGMALGIGTLLIGPPALLIYFLAVSLLVMGRWPGGAPPAWDAGRAIPWPAPGEAPPPPDPEPLADPEDFEGSGTEVPSERPGRRDNRRKRKRKTR